MQQKVPEELIALPGTMSIHQIITTEKQGFVTYRDLSLRLWPEKEFLCMMNEEKELEIDYEMMMNKEKELKIDDKMKMAEEKELDIYDEMKMNEEKEIDIDAEVKMNEENSPSCETSVKILSEVAVRMILNENIGNLQIILVNKVETEPNVRNQGNFQDKKTETNKWEINNTVLIR